MRISKAHQRFNLNGWLNRMREDSGTGYILDDERLGFELSVELSRLSGKQLRVANALVAAAYRLGNEDSRAFRRSMLEDRHNAPVYAKRSQFKLISGGAA